MLSLSSIYMTAHFDMSPFAVVGSSNRHVEAHESAGRPEDDGGDEEGGWLRFAAPRQLQQQDTGGR